MEGRLPFPQRPPLIEARGERKRRDRQGLVSRRSAMQSCRFNFKGNTLAASALVWILKTQSKCGNGWVALTLPAPFSLFGLTNSGLLRRRLQMGEHQSFVSTDARKIQFAGFELKCTPQVLRISASLKVHQKNLVAAGCTYFHITPRHR